MNERDIIARDIEASRLLRERLGVVITNEVVLPATFNDDPETPDELADPLDDPEIAEAEYPAPFEEGDETPEEVKAVNWEIRTVYSQEQGK